MKTEKLKDRDVIIGAILTVLCMIIYFMMMFSDLHLMTHARTGLSPAFFPELAFFLLIILSATLFISSLVRRREEDKTEIEKKLDRTQIRQVAVILITSIIYINLIDVIGFYICSFLTLIAAMLVLKVRSWFKMLLSSTILMVIIFLFFENALKILLPRGFLF